MAKKIACFTDIEKSSKKSQGEFAQEIFPRWIFSWRLCPGGGGGPGTDICIIINLPTECIEKH